jgi:D-sedoheptulose 7-phosphate isomerase
LVGTHPCWLFYIHQASYGKIAFGCPSPSLNPFPLLRPTLWTGCGGISKRVLKPSASCCGNGGSASDAQHIAAEFVSVLSQDFQRPGLAAIALTTDSSVLTASANDFGFAGVFERQVQALGRPGDMVIGISTSGNSENVLRAVAYARSHGMRTIGLTGSSQCKLAETAEIVLRAPSPVTRFIQETHIMMGHILCELVEQSLTYHSHGPNPDGPNP